MIKVRKIFKSFDKQIVLKDVSFHIKREGLYFIVGKSGVGKTTLLNIITKEDTEYKGKVKVGKVNVDEENEFYDRIIKIIEEGSHDIS